VKVLPVALISAGFLISCTSKVHPPTKSSLPTVEELSGYRVLQKSEVCAERKWVGKECNTIKLIRSPEGKDYLVLEPLKEGQNWKKRTYVAPCDLDEFKVKKECETGHEYLKLAIHSSSIYFGHGRTDLDLCEGAIAPANPENTFFVYWNRGKLRLCYRSVHYTRFGFDIYKHINDHCGDWIDLKPYLPEPCE